MNKSGLDKLIEQILIEKRLDVSAFPMDPKPGDNPSPRHIAKKLDLHPMDGILSVDDLNYYFKNPDEISVDIQKRLIQLKRIPIPEDPQTDQERFFTSEEFKNIQELASDLLDLKDELATKPDIEPGGQTISAPRIHSQGGESGKFPKEYELVVEKVLGHRVKIATRIREISRISTKYYQASQDPRQAKRIAKESVQTTLRELLLLDVMNYIVKEMDSGSGAYLFEYFLAMVCGGRVEGKMKTPAGQMAATDFTMYTGEKGSAKCYRDSSNMSQASAGFLPGNTTYVIGLKKQDHLQINRSQGGTDPDKLVAIDLHFLTVKKDKKGKITVNGDPQEGSRVGLTPYVNQQSKGRHVLYLASVYTKTFRDMIDDAIGNVNDSRQSGIKQAYESMKKLYDSIRETESQSKIYIAEDDQHKRIDAGLKTLQSIEAQDESFKDLINNIDFGNTLDKKDLAESNQKELDQVIESIVKKMLIK